MYMANHNLNAEIKIDKLDVLLPAVAELPISNKADGHASLGEMQNTCLGKELYFRLPSLAHCGDLNEEKALS